MQENTAQTVTEWVFVAKSVAQMPYGQNPALRCMAHANMAAQDMGDWLAVAKVWMHDFGDAKMGRQCMAKAEGIAGNSEEVDVWIGIAKIWKEDFQDLDSVARCMEVVEATAENISGWVRIAKIWKDDFQDTENAKGCIEEAEDMAEDIADWVRIAKIWKNDFQDTENAIRCMEKAGDLAEDFDDYATLEETWRVDFQDVDRDIVNSAIQRLVNAADGEGYFDGIRAYVSHANALEQADITDLGILAETSVSSVGDYECVSVRRQDRYAQYYRFTLAQDVDVTIDLISEVDTYLYLISGDNPTGEILEENDDRPDDDDEGLSNTDSRIRRRLPAGTYAIEATTWDEGETGEFTLNITIG